MYTQFNERKFKTLIKITKVIAKILFIFTIFSLVVILLSMIVVAALPKDVLTVDLSMVQHINVEIMNIQFRLSTTMFTGDVLLKNSLLLGLVAGAFYMVFFSYVVHQMGRILRDVSEEIPFSENNVKSLYNMSLAYIVGGIVLPIFLALFSWQFIHAAGIAEASVSYSMHTNMIAGGILIWILASIFQYGAFLQGEVDQTV